MHLIQRGNNRGACFFSDADFAYYLHHLALLAGESGCAVHAYVLMTNHAHLLVTPAEVESASLMMKRLGQRFVQHVNRTYGRSGTLWEGRFRSSIVQNDDYLFRCYRYIELNPVRAGMVRDPASYRWSSYRINAGLAVSAWVTPHEQYLALGANPSERASAYRELFRAELASRDVDEIRRAAKGGFALGSARFKAEIAAMLGRRVEHATPERRSGTDPLWGSFPD